MIVLRATVFGEVMDLENNSFVRLREASDHLRDQRVLAKRMIVKMPDIRRSTESFTSGGAETVEQFLGRDIRRSREIAEARDDADGKIIRSGTGEDDMADFGFR